MAPASAEPKRKRARVVHTVKGAVDAAEGVARERAESASDALGAASVSLALDAALRGARARRAALDAAPALLRALRAALTADGALTSANGNDTVTAADPLAQDTLRRAPALCLHAKQPASVTFALAPPEDVAVVGSFMLGLTADPLVIDVAVQMPRSIFKSKDYLNFRYHDKRLLYLIHVADVVRKMELVGDVAIGEDFLADNPNKPVATVRPHGSGRFAIRLLPTIASDVFDSEKLALSRGNVRPAGESSLSVSPTPRYNMSVLMDSAVTRHLATLHARVSSAPAFADAALMLRLWTRRRRLGVRAASAAPAASGFVVAAILAHTIASAAAPARASREHLFRAALTVVREGVLDRLVVDGVHVAAGWPEGLLQRWRREAESAFQAIDAPGAAVDAWAGVVPFLFTSARGSSCRPVPLSTIFDAFVSFSVPDRSEQNARKSKSKGTASKSDAARELPPRKDLHALLHRALVDTRRVHSVETLSNEMYGVVFHEPSAERDAYRKVDLRSDDVDAAVFKEFWGPKAELRRFKDGRIVESLVWTGGRGVIDEIVAYACSQHFGKGVRSCVSLAQVEDSAGLLGVDTEAAKAIVVFNELASSLRKVKDLPLAVTTVLAVSPLLRRCAVQPVRPNPKGAYVEPLDILAVFEKSAAWPNDMLAMASAKAAFYLALRKGLADLGIASRATVSFLDILSGGFVFRLRVKVESEKSMDGISKDVSRRLEWEMESKVAIHEAMRNVSSSEFPDVARLLKRWFAAHMLLSSFGERGEELMELFAARVFLVHHGQAPRSVLSGFCQCLHLLAEFPWEVAPLVVPTARAARLGEKRGLDVSAAGDSSEEHEACKELFENAHDTFSNREPSAARACAVHVACTPNEDGSWFSGGDAGPERVVMKRASAAAAAALAYIEARITPARIDGDGDRTVDARWVALFRTPTSSFDKTLVIDRQWVPRGPTLAKGPLCSGRPAMRLDTAIVGLDPMERLLHELKEALGHHAMFMYDKYGGSRIYVVWRPAAATAVPFSLKSMAYMTPRPDSTTLEPNKDEMLAEMKHIGGSMIRCIE